MKNITMHISYPATATAIFFVIAMLPVELLGCYNRGLIDAFVGVVAGIARIFSAVKALMGKIHGDAKSFFLDDECPYFCCSGYLHCYCNGLKPNRYSGRRYCVNAKQGRLALKRNLQCEPFQEYMHDTFKIDEEKCDSHKADRSLWNELSSLSSIYSRQEGLSWLPKRRQFQI